MAGILGNEGSLTGKAIQLANAVTGETTQADGIPTVQILLNDFKAHGINPKAGIFGALAELKQGGLKMYRKGNTIFAVKKLNPITAQIHFFTVDQEQEFNALVKEFLGSLIKSGCKVVYERVADPHIIKALQAAGAQIVQSDVRNYPLKAYI